MDSVLKMSSMLNQLEKDRENLVKKDKASVSDTNENGYAQKKTKSNSKSGKKKPEEESTYEKIQKMLNSDKNSKSSNDNNPLSKLKENFNSSNKQTSTAPSSQPTEVNVGLPNLNRL